MCSFLQSGQRLGERTDVLLVNVKPQARHCAGFIINEPLRERCICSKWTYTSLCEMCIAWEISCAVHSPSCSSAIISFRNVFAISIFKGNNYEIASLFFLQRRDFKSSTTE